MAGGGEVTAIASASFACCTRQPISARQSEILRKSSGFRATRDTSAGDVMMPAGGEVVTVLLEGGEDKGLAVWCWRRWRWCTRVPERVGVCGPLCEVDEG